MNHQEPNGSSPQMNHQEQQIADPQMLRKLHSFTSSRTNSIINSADEVLEAIWCDIKQVPNA